MIRDPYYFESSSGPLTSPLLNIIAVPVPSPLPKPTVFSPPLPTTTTAFAGLAEEDSALLDLLLLFKCVSRPVRSCCRRFVAN